MNITITIDTSNAAFKPPGGDDLPKPILAMWRYREIIRILSMWTAKSVSAGVPIEQKLLDCNGNPVGVVKVEYDESEQEQEDALAEEDDDDKDLP